MTVQAKFYVQKISQVHTLAPNEVCAVIELAAVYGNGKENASWSKYTPQGKIEMTVTNPAAINYFDLGGEVYITFEKKEKAVDNG